MRKEAKLKDILEDFLKSRKIIAPTVKVAIVLSDFSYTIQYGLN